MKKLIMLVLALLILSLSGCGNPSPTAGGGAAPTVPAAPVAAATAGNAQNTITWAAISGATSYKIYVATNSAASTAAQIMAAASTTPGTIASPYAHTGLTNGTSYSYAVTALNNVGESAPSNVVSASPSAAIAAAPTVTSFTPASGAVGTTVTIAGTGFSTTAASNTVTFNGTAATVSAATATQLTTSVPTGATTGNIAVATNGQGASSYPVSRTFTVLVPPTAPTGVTATASNTAAIITWTAVTGATSYNIYYSQVSANATKAAGTKVAGVTSPATVSALTNGLTYYFVVTAVNADGESVESSVVNATPNSVSIHASLVDAQGGLPPGFKNAFVQVQNNGTTVPTATVTIGSTSLAYNATSQQYEAAITVTKGATYALSVSGIPGVAYTYTSSGNMFTTYPTITSPASGTTIASTSTTAVSWTQGAPTTAQGTVSNDVGIANATFSGFLYGAAGGGGPLAIPLATTYNLVPANFYGTGSGTLLVGISQSLPISNAGSGGNFWIAGFGAITVTVQ